jgi:hypothetical protein
MFANRSVSEELMSMLCERRKGVYSYMGDEEHLDLIVELSG